MVRGITESMTRNHPLKTGKKIKSLDFVFVAIRKNNLPIKRGFEQIAKKIKIEDWSAKWLSRYRHYESRTLSLTSQNSGKGGMRSDPLKLCLTFACHSTVPTHMPTTHK